ncbi:uncharacterized protein B0H64DRAFT_388490 [Chaetomium fimeti]|uniref:Uncharacterized protein n=1 Tax=Chaetomium fimeti TaxID=1854472 RepID=A0AAE0LVV9_9PEZI|nr:hypothetical protein B0H64DRAFT_388490 [Chaetomium fimeti]
MLPASKPQTSVTTPDRHFDQSRTSENISTDAPRLRSSINTGRWSATEDDRLREAVARCGTRWVTVAAGVGTRNAEQCAKRWNDNVNPDLDHSFWSAEEDKLLLSLVGVHGHNWKLMAESFLSARAPLAIKNRHSLLMRRQKRQNAKQQLPSTALSWDRGLSTLNTRYTPPTGPHPPCRVDILGIASASSSSSSSSPFPLQGHASADSASPPMHAVGAPFTPSHQRTITHEGGVSTKMNYAVDLSDLLLSHGTPADQGGHIMGNQSTFSPPGGDPSQSREIGYPRWDGHGLGNGIDLGSLLGGADLPMRSGDGDNVMLGPDGGTQVGGGSDKGIEFSVTCSRSKLKAMVCHAFEGAMTETAELSEEEPVTVTLRLRR